jgi:cyclophilin family peptidyl-prolyl cis-trans isomerase
MRHAIACLMFGVAGVASAIGNSNRDKPPTTAQVLESAQPGDWRRPDPGNLLYLELPAGRVVIELAPRFAPAHVANIQALAREKFFDGLPVSRVQDNFVVQWGDADKIRPTETASRKLPDETVLAWNKSLPIVKLPDADGYAPESGWLDGFPVGIERKPSGQVWMTHCYGVLGVGRDNWPDNGSGAELYVVIGQAPRQLDRNIVTAGALGYYEKPEQRTLISRARIAADLPETERTALEVLRTDTPLFTRYVEARRNRRDDWYLVPAGHTDVCSISIPVRDIK